MNNSTQDTYNFDLSCNYDKALLVNQIKLDKTSNGNTINFVLIKNVGEVETKKITYSDLIK